MGGDAPTVPVRIDFNEVIDPVTGEVTVLELPDNIIEALPVEFPALPNGLGYRQTPVWDRRIAARMVYEIANGRTVKELLAEPWAPARSTWYTWMVRVPELGKLIPGALVAQSHAFFDEAVQTARDNAASPKSDVKNGAVRILLDTLKWAAGKRNPSEYGEKALAIPALTINISTNLDVDDTAVLGGAREAPLDMEEAGGIYTVKAALPALPDPTLTEPPRSGGGREDEMGEPPPATRRRRGKQKRFDGYHDPVALRRRVEEADRGGTEKKDPI